MKLVMTVHLAVPIHPERLSHICPRMLATPHPRKGRNNVPVITQDRMLRTQKKYNLLHKIDKTLNSGDRIGVH